VYVDIPKNEIQFRGEPAARTTLALHIFPKEMYKRFFFVWIAALNRHKATCFRALIWSWMSRDLMSLPGLTRMCCATP
jgi:hypothetical protein